MNNKVKAALAGAGALTAVNAVRAAMFVPEKKDWGTAEPEKIDVERAQEHISGAIQIKTVSYPDKSLVDFGEFEKFHKFLEESFPLIHKTMEKEIVHEASLMYRWKGTNPDLDPMAMLSHQDVVPIEEGTEDDWTHPAFSGYNDGEFIWGRGALDMKNHLICVMEAIENLIAEGFQPERDVYLCFGQDEEVVASGDSGAKAMMEVFKERGIHLDSLVDEGGAVLDLNIPGVIKNKKLIGVGIAEKGYTDIKISVHSDGGHSSQPPKHSAIGEIADVVKDLENHQFKSSLMPFVSELFSGIGRNCTYPARLVTCNIPFMKPLIKEVMKQIPPAACLVRTTTAVTMTEGSPAANVLAQNASITVNFRQMPGTTVEDVVKHIRKVCRNKDISIEILKQKEASKFSPTDSVPFKILEKICKQQNPDSFVAPYLVMGGTDACYYEPVCENILRYSPFNVTVEELRCTHNTNERLPLKTIEEAITFFMRWVRRASSENGLEE